MVEEGEEHERTFDVPGKYTYYYIPHEAQGMISYLTVEKYPVPAAGLAVSIRQP